MSSNAAVAATWSEFLEDLGQIPAHRVRRDPTPGTATIDDLVRINEGGGRCELVDGALVEKAMGWQQSLIAMVLGEIIGGFVRKNKLGWVTGPDGFIKLFPDVVRGPDVAFFSRQRTPNGKLPQEKVPAIVPDLAIEVLSESNTRSEMMRKCREYFLAGATQVWMFDLRQRTVAVYTAVSAYQVFDEDQVLSAGDILPGLSVSLAEVFGELDDEQFDERAKSPAPQ